MKLSEIRKACEALPDGDLSIDQLRAFLPIARTALPALLEVIASILDDEAHGCDVEAVRGLRNAGIEADE